MTSLERGRPERPEGAPTQPLGRGLSRRGFLLGTGAAAAAVLIGRSVVDGSPSAAARSVASAGPLRTWGLVATDGWVSMPLQARPYPPFWPDTLGGVEDTNLYVFGFRRADRVWTDASFNPEDLENQAQISAPLLFCDVGDDVRLRLMNAALLNRPDLVDSHTFHWHGFSNQVPYFDGVPDDSFSVPVDSSAVYRFLPEEPGTYMYHCHFEDVEHVQAGMTGIVFVRPAGHPERAYDDPRTAVDRQFAVLLTEVFAEHHFTSSHIQETNWTDMRPTFALMNGRAYPDTLAPSVDPDDPPPSGDPLHRLRFQPMTSLVEANAGEKVLLRLANLGSFEHSLVLPGLDMRVVGADARPLVGSRTAANDTPTTPPLRIAATPATSPTGSTWAPGRAATWSSTPPPSGRWPRRARSTSTTATWASSSPTPGPPTVPEPRGTAGCAPR